MSIILICILIFLITCLFIWGGIHSCHNIYEEVRLQVQILVFLLNPKRQGLSCYFCCIAYYKLASSQTSGQFSSLYLPYHNKNVKIKDVCYHTWLFYLSFRSQSQVARQFYMPSHFSSSCFSRNISYAKKQNPL